MSPTHKGPRLALSLVLAGAGLAACGGTGSASGTKNYVDGRTFTMTVPSDPGALDPQGSVVNSLLQLNQFAYDALVSVDAKTGKVRPQLATSWKVVDTRTVTFDIRSGVTCSDGSVFDAKTVADNISHVEDPKNKSPLLGVFVPAGARATASGSTVELKLAAPSPFLLSSLSFVPMVCASGLKDRTGLKDHTAGTGPYTLTQATPGAEYVYKARDGYTWGPGGAKTAAKGMPARIVVKIVDNETTAANQLLAGETNAAQIGGPDGARLKAAGLTSVDTTTVVGEQWYNHAKGHPTGDPAVRMALTRGADYAQLAKVLTSGKGTAATQLAALSSSGCDGNSVAGNVPSFDPAAAGATLDAAGWKKGSNGVRAKNGTGLSLTFITDATLGTGGAAAAELAVSQWKALGIKVTLKNLSTTEMAGPLFSTGDWDIAWEPVNVPTPDQMLPTLSGATVPNGSNFSSIENTDYTSSATKAMNETGTDGCPAWLKAESSLFKAADLVPFANKDIPTFGKGATFTSTANLVVPSSIRMLG
ncbi:peptide/nickel transport system substrate-binding protein [Streptomyces aurantiacus]|uniref:ABC transporter substrate-binding protein n=1 Tax=Streptomyces aurantiacus TaxID=47760 RepID=UPI002794BAED|nr:ABC transporter substrate-binding protein [Streptomyces aurantiacus]MDQ0779908.1 peptide/nickel transport system substrate-binding protein [Streptomyces aurantiacus]